MGSGPFDDHEADKWRYGLMRFWRRNGDYTAGRRDPIEPGQTSMTTSHNLLRDFREALHEAVRLAIEAHKADEDTRDIPDDLIVWFLRHAPGPKDESRGWSNARTRWPKHDHTCRVAAIVGMVDAGLSYAAVSRILELDRGHVQHVYQKHMGLDVTSR